MSESKQFVAGAGRYVDDIKLPNMLHMMVARSPFAYAKILSIKGGLNGNDLKAATSSAGEAGGGNINPALIHPALAQKLKTQVKNKEGKYSPENLLKGNYVSENLKDQNVQLNSFGAEVATVAIDKFGIVKVKECGACYDVGRALSPKVVEPNHRRNHAGHRASAL